MPVDEGHSANERALRIRSKSRLKRPVQYRAYITDLHGFISLCPPPPHKYTRQRQDCIMLAIEDQTSTGAPDFEPLNGQQGEDTLVRSGKELMNFRLKN
jgi:hypothetical protein